MDSAKLQAKLAETKAELERLKESLTIATPVVHKDLSLVSLVPEWSGSDASIPLKDFFRALNQQAVWVDGKTETAWRSHL